MLQAFSRAVLEWYIRFIDISYDRPLRIELFGFALLDRHVDLSFNELLASQC